MIGEKAPEFLTISELKMTLAVVASDARDRTITISMMNGKEDDDFMSRRSLLSVNDLKLIILIKFNEEFIVKFL